MKLAFQCQQDPKQMPTKNGTKFCQHCQKKVFDIRRKSQEKVIEFYRKNPHACVLAYEDQIERIPQYKLGTKSTNYMPYAAGIIAVSLLPSLTMAQVNTAPNFHFIGTAIHQQQQSNGSNEQSANVKNAEKYFIEGKVTITDKKTKTRRGKEIIIYKIVRDSKGEYIDEDTLSIGELNLNGKFKLEISKSTFDLLQQKNDDVWLNVDGFSRENIEELSADGNVIKVAITVSARRRVMGALF